MRIIAKHIAGIVEDWRQERKQIKAAHREARKLGIQERQVQIKKTAVFKSQLQGIRKRNSMRLGYRPAVIELQRGIRSIAEGVRDGPLGREIRGPRL